MGLGVMEMGPGGLLGRKAGQVSSPIPSMQLPAVGCLEFLTLLHCITPLQGEWL